VPFIHPTALPVPAGKQQLTGREKVRMLSRMARRALLYSADFSGLSLGELLKTDAGAPVPSQGVHWSLTHKNGWVAAVAAPDAVGIDLETIREVDTRLYDRVADKMEWSRIGEPTLDRFFRLWTAKEAVLKATGRGIAGLGKCRFDTMVNHDTLRMIYDGSAWMVTHHWIGREHVIAVTAEPDVIKWHILSENNI
jgi:4'-phosphopantetheinyl transferase